jgi:hypothetical protein
LNQACAEGLKAEQKSPLELTNALWLFLPELFLWSGLLADVSVVDYAKQYVLLALFSFLRRFTVLPILLFQS